MKIRQLLGAAALTTLALGTAGTASAHAAPAVHGSASRHACTKSSSGSCIRGGAYCPQASYGHSGYDASGRRWVCKGDRSHPHWEKP